MIRTLEKIEWEVIIMRSVLKTLIIAIAVMIGIALGIEYLGGIIEVGIEILLFLLCISFLAAGFILGPLA